MTDGHTNPSADPEARLGAAPHAELPAGARARLEAALHAAAEPARSHPRFSAKSGLLRRPVPLGYAAAASLLLAAGAYFAARATEAPPVTQAMPQPVNPPTPTRPTQPTVLLASNRVPVAAASRPQLTHEPPRIDRWQQSPSQGALK